MNEIDRQKTAIMNSKDLSQNIEALERIDKICSDFEMRCQESLSWPCISEYLQRVHSSERSRLLVELILLDVECRVNHGEIINVDSYFNEFPDYLPVVQSVSDRIRGKSNSR